MSEAPAKPVTPVAPGAKSSKIVLLLLLLNLGASGFMVYQMLMAEPAHAAAPAPAEPKGDTQEVTGPILSLEPFVVNLDETASSRYLRVKLQLELGSASAEAPINKSLLLVRDVILSHLSGLKLVDTLGAQAKEKVRTELLTRLEAAIGPNKIRRMFFTEWVVQ